MIDFLVDYILPNGEYRYHTLKMQSGDVSLACESAVEFITECGGQAYSIQHIPGDRSISELQAIARGTVKASKLILAWIDPELVQLHCNKDEICAMLQIAEKAEIQQKLALMLVPNSKGKTALYFPPRRR